MSHLLPPPGHKAREMFDVSDLAAIGTKQRQAPLFRDCLASAKRSFAADTSGAMKRIMFICLRADDSLWLISVGRRGGWRKEWDFSQ